MTAKSKASLKEQYQKASERIERFSLRERAILLGTAVILVGFLWLQFVFDPMDRAQKRSKALSLQSEGEIVSLSEEQAILDEKIKQDPNIVLRRQQEQLVTQIEQQRLLLEEKLQGLIAPAKMVDVLKEVLSATSGLSLITARNMPVQRFSAGGPEQTEEKPKNRASADAEAKEPEESALPLYLHGLELVIEGDYYAVVDYLRQLEHLEQGFQWSVLDYRVGKYPLGRVKIQVQTVSLDEQWIGV